MAIEFHDLLKELSFYCLYVIDLALVFISVLMLQKDTAFQTPDKPDVEEENQRKRIRLIKISQSEVTSSETKGVMLKLEMLKDTMEARESEIVTLIGRLAELESEIAKNKGKTADAGNKMDGSIREGESLDKIGRNVNDSRGTETCFSQEEAKANDRNYDVERLEGGKVEKENLHERRRMDSFERDLEILPDEHGKIKENLHERRKMDSFERDLEILPDEHGKIKENSHERRRKDSFERDLEILSDEHGKIKENLQALKRTKGEREGQISSLKEETEISRKEIMERENHTESSEQQNVENHQKMSSVGRVLENLSQKVRGMKEDFQEMKVIHYSEERPLMEVQGARGKLRVKKQPKDEDDYSASSATYSQQAVHIKPNFQVKNKMWTVFLQTPVFDTRSPLNLEFIRVRKMLIKPKFKQAFSAKVSLDNRIQGRINDIATEIGLVTEETVDGSYMTLEEARRLRIAHLIEKALVPESEYSVAFGGLGIIGVIRNLPVSLGLNLNVRVTFYLQDRVMCPEVCIGNEMLAEYGCIRQFHSKGSVLMLEKDFSRVKSDLLERPLSFPVVLSDKGIPQDCKELHIHISERPHSYVTRRYLTRKKYDFKKHPITDLLISSLADEGRRKGKISIVDNVPYSNGDVVIGSLHMSTVGAIVDYRRKVFYLKLNSFIYPWYWINMRPKVLVEYCSPVMITPGSMKKRKNGEESQEKEKAWKDRFANLWKLGKKDNENT